MKLKWYLRQIFPTKFATAYRESDTSKPFFATWWMWFGRCFKAKHVAI